MPETTPDEAKRLLAKAARFPYDAPDSWWSSSAKMGPAAVDWAHAAARGVLADLTDRGGIKRAFEGIDQDVRSDIVCALSAIIRAAAEDAAGPPSTTERHIALREGHEIGNSNAYFEARPHLDAPEARRLFRDGFSRGFDAGEKVYADGKS